MNVDNLVSQLRSELNRIEQAIAALEALGGGAARPKRGRPPKASGARHMSAAARRRISEAMKQRWAKWKGKSAPKQAKAKPQKKAVRRPMSAAARKKLSAMMKARWEARKKAQA